MIFTDRRAGFIIEQAIKNICDELYNFERNPIFGPYAALTTYLIITRHKGLLVPKNTQYVDIQIVFYINAKKNILEVGIGDFGYKNGGSLLLWKNYFTNATIFGVDILPLDRVLDDLINDKE